MRVSFALDCRLELGKASSYTRVLDLLRAGARAANLPFSEWTTGPCSAPILWSPSPDLPHGLPGVNLIPTLHDITPLLPDDRNFLQRWRNATRFRRAVSKMSAKSSLIITGSQFAQDSIQEEFPLLGHKLRIVPHFPDEQFSSDAVGTLDAEAMESLGLPSGAVLFLAALRRHKNWETLLRAWAQIPAGLRKKHPLILAGDARRAKGLPQKIAEKLNVTQHLFLPGRIPDDSLPALYRSASAFVFPSYAEGFGLPPLEAMACGTPVISSNTTSLPEVLGEACFYFEPHDTKKLTAQLNTLLAHPSEGRRLSNLGLQQAQRWSAIRTGEAMKSVLEEVSL